MAADPYTKSQELLEAASTGQLSRLKKLAVELDDGRGIAKTVQGIRDNDGLSALHCATAKGNLDVCIYVIDVFNFDVNVKNLKYKGDTPLHYASFQGHLSTAVYLLKKGANPDMKNDDGSTPLHYVAYEGHPELMDLLLSKGGNGNAVGVYGTPLSRAVDAICMDRMDLLLSKSGNVNAVGIYGTPLIRDVDAICMDREAGKRKHKVVEILLEYHANPNLSFHGGYTPLASCVRAESFACFKLLLEAGADPNAGSCGVRPLILAADRGDKEMVKCLLEAGGDPNVIDEFGLTPIEIAALKRKLEVVKILYPATSPIPTCTDWSIDGIMRHVNSEEAIQQIPPKRMKALEEFKTKGDDAFRNKDYMSAMAWYTRGINQTPGDAILLSNRSLCLTRMKKGEMALSDAERCMMLAPKWPKAYYRAGAAWELLENFDEAVVAFSKGLELDPNNKELQKAFQEAKAKGVHKDNE